MPMMTGHRPQCWGVRDMDRIEEPTQETATLRETGPRPPAREDPADGG